MIQPLPGGTHAAVVAARDATMRRLLFHSLDAGQPDSTLVHEADSEDALLGQVLISRPAVVVVDTELAGGDGLSACARLKENPITRETSVVVISSRYDRIDYDLALAAGADAFLIKPFSPLRLRALAAELCAEARAAELDSAVASSAWRASAFAPGRAASGAPSDQAHLAGRAAHPERYDLPSVLRDAIARDQTRSRGPARPARLAG